MPTSDDADFEVAEMTGDDYEAVIALWRSTEGLLLNDADEKARIFAYLKRNPGLSFVAKSKDQIAGAVLCGHDGRRGYLHHLAVRADCRRKGIGRTLVERSLAALGRQGIARCNIFVLTDNEEGSRFWRRNGWFDCPNLKLMSKETSVNLPDAP
jgi:putative acetyltransferase